MVAMVRAVVCLSLWMAVCQARGFTIPTDMNRTIQSILNHYKVPDRLTFNGKAIFPNEMMPEQLEAKKMVMGGVLNTYEKLINQMLKGLPTPSPPTTGNTETASDLKGSDGKVRKELNYILDKIMVLKRHRYREQEKVLEGLQQLRRIQTDDSVIQAKALWELSGLYQEASSLSNSTEREKQQQRRRRRQARKASKIHVRG